MIRAQILKNGALKITADNEGRAELKYQSARDGYYAAEAEVTEGLRDRFDLVRAEWIGALTDAPIFTDELKMDDDGEVVGVGDVWWFPNYMVENPWETLKNTGRVIFEPEENNRSLPKTA